LSKSLITNLISAFFILIGLLFQNEYSNTFYSIGFFALSGSLTNWLAIQMLFEKVPLLYGSGVILDRFIDIKSGIRDLVLEELFSNKNIDQFFHKSDLSPDKIYEKVDFEKLFIGLLDAIESSKLGPMLSMIGGREALLPIKEPVINKLKKIIKEKIESIFEHNDESNFTSNIRDGIKKALNQKLDELNPIDVKIIIENMIRKHLGWLIVWGGFFGGLFGLVFSSISLFI